MLTIPRTIEIKNEPKPLTLSEDIRIVRLINELIELDEAWHSYDEELIQRLIDTYRYLKDKAHPFIPTKK